MCLILVAWRAREEYPLVVAANRDEFHARPAAEAKFWDDHPGILAGRDLQAMGTWLGVSRSGRFASVTNVRGGRDPDALESRGTLVTGFLAADSPPEVFVKTVRPANHSGFNLLVADRQDLWWLSNRADGARRLAPGCYAVGNELLDTPEVIAIRDRFARAPAAAEPLFSLLAEAKIVASAYGTRCASVLLAGRGGRIQFSERAFDPAGRAGATLRFEFSRAG